MNGSLWFMSMVELADGFLRLLFPRICPSCARDLKQSESLICLHCHYALTEQCFLQHMQEYDHFLKVSYPHVRLFALFPYHKEAIIQRLLYQVKYERNRSIGMELGRLMAELTVPHVFHDASLIPVPMDRKRLHKRGYNQCEVLAQGISEVLSCTVHSDILMRIQLSESQTRKTREERWENLRSQVRLTDNHKPLRSKVVLIDDVLTTGATIAACLEALSQYPNLEISILTLARSDEL